MVQGSIRFVQIERDNSRRRKEKRNDNEIDFERWLFVLFTNGSRFRFNHSERSRVIYLSFDPVAHAREMYVSIGSFPFSRASQKWIRNCLRPGGNKKLRAMIRNRSSAPLPARPNAFHATTRFFVSRRLFAPLLRAPAHRKYAAHGTNGFCRGGGPLCSFVTQHLLLSILWTLPDTPWIRRFCLVSFFLSLFFFFILHPF